MKSTSVAVLHCSAQTNATHVMQKLTQACVVATRQSGKVFRPKEGERLVLYLKDINLPKPDSYGTVQLIAFLQQLVTYRGFYDDNMQWIALENVSLVATMNPPTSLGRYVPMFPMLRFLMCDIFFALASL